MLRMQHSLLKEVNPATQKWMVKVRLVRFSEYLAADDPSKIQRLDFVMLDEQGKSMEGQILAKWLPQFYPGLKEDTVYIIHYFEVANARPNYRLVDHPYMARFTKHTKAREAVTVPDTFPLYACKILTFTELRARDKERDPLSDTVGLLTQCSDITIQNTRSGKRALRSVYITDGTETAKVALWGPHANQFEADKYIEMSRQGPVALLFTGLTAGLFNGQLSLQASPMCRWYVNPALPEAIALQDRFCAMVGPAQHLGGPQAAAGGPTTVEDLSKEENPHDIWGNKYTVMAEIKSLIPDEPWWYMACTKCLHRSKEHGAAYRCTDFECTGASARPRYRLGLIAVHPGNSNLSNAASIDLVSFGPRAEELIGAPVDALIDAGAGVQGFLPPQISRLYGRQYQFSLSVPRSALGRERPSFKIDSFTPAPAAAELLSESAGPVTTHLPAAIPAEPTTVVQDTMTPLPDPALHTPPPLLQTPPVSSPTITEQTKDGLMPGDEQGSTSDGKRRRKSKTTRLLFSEEDGE